MNLRPLPALLTSLALSACVGSVDANSLGNGNGNGDGVHEDELAGADAAPPPVDYTITIPPELAEIELGGQWSYVATVSSESFAGPLTLSLVGALPTWDVSYSPAETIDLANDQSVEVIMTVTIPTDGEAGAAALAFTVDGELGSRSATGNINVADRVTLGIPDGTGGDGNHFGGVVKVRAGTEIVILNRDTTVHRIHAKPHQDVGMEQGDSYILNYDRAGTESAYCHIHGPNTGVLKFEIE